MKKYKFQGLSGNTKSIKIKRDVKKVKPRLSRSQCRMNSDAKAIKATRGYELIIALTERAIRINSTK